MSGWFEGILISKSIQHNFNIRVLFRFQSDYVNLPISRIFRALLHNQHLRGIAGNDVITYISTEFEL